IGSDDESQTHPLRYRPAHYVPIQVPIYDEVATQIQNDANGNGETEPLYRWVYRPELQLSQYSFEAKSIIVNQSDDDGNESTTNINIEENEADFGPVFDEYTDSVELLFDLLGPELDHLPALENDREFVLSLGGEEAIATIGADGKVIFNNPDHLNQLTEEDLLSLRLYLNGDAGNVLWEYQIAGFNPFWSVYPNQQPQRIRKASSVENSVAQSLGMDIKNFIAEIPNVIQLIPSAHADIPLVNAHDLETNYILGGMRIKLVFTPERKDEYGDPIQIIWNVNGDEGLKGNLYPDDNPESAGVKNKTVGIVDPDSTDSYSTYYQPSVWQTGVDDIISVRIRYADHLLPIRYDFRVETRELFPVSTDSPNPYNTEDPQAPIKGSDVAMLEDLLWQLGLSPQYGFPGGSGSRIDAIDPQGSAIVESHPRNVFSVGDDFQRVLNNPDATREQRAQGSLEKMVRRLQGHFEVIGTGGATNESISSGFTGNADGIVDDVTLSNLKILYDDYRKAIFDHTHTVVRINYNAGSLNLINGEQSWVDDALIIWGRAYSDNTHAGLLAVGEVVARQDVLLAWLYHEGQSQWGVRGDPVAARPYRMTIGDGDEYGSMGFNQLLFQYVYGSAQRCDLNTYNNFSPAENISAFTHYTSNVDEDDECDDTLRRLFVSDQGELSFNNATAFATGLPKVRGFYRVAGNITNVAEAVSRNDDNYEKLGKAILGYNAGRGAINWNSWVGFLLDLTPVATEKSSNDSNEARPFHAFEYAIKVKRTAGLLLRTYILEWQVTAEQAAASTLYTVGQTFCFTYSENEWYQSELNGQAYNWWTTKRDQILNGTAAALTACPGE
ncbi:MAG: hypothetical protein COA78_38780, partial [Blastopirellula sp.]